MMEDVQFSNTTESSTIMPELDDNLITTTEQPILPSEESKTTVEDAAPVPEAPILTAEVVIEKKEELEPEDPILPDHYYDNGNIPVFKPVLIKPEPFLLILSRRWINFAILKSSSLESMIMVCMRELSK
jgi:hypothetical protein